MLYCDKIDTSGGIDVNKTSTSRECIICHYSYVLEGGFQKLVFFQLAVCNGYHVLMMSIDLTINAILNIYGAEYQCIINGITKVKLYINLFKKCRFGWKNQNIKCKFSLWYIKNE